MSAGMSWEAGRDMNALPVSSGADGHLDAVFNSSGWRVNFADGDIDTAEGGGGGLLGLGSDSIALYVLAAAVVIAAIRLSKGKK